MLKFLSDYEEKFKKEGFKELLNKEGNGQGCQKYNCFNYRKDTKNQKGGILVIGFNPKCLDHKGGKGYDKCINDSNEEDDQNKRYCLNANYDIYFGIFLIRRRETLQNQIIRQRTSKMEII